MANLRTAPVGEARFGRLRCLSCADPWYPTACWLSQVVFPGQSLCKLPDTGQLRVGPGLEAYNENLCTTKSGILRKTKVGKLWVEGRQKR